MPRSPVFLAATAFTLIAALPLQAQVAPTEPVQQQAPPAQPPPVQPPPADAQTPPQTPPDPVSTQAPPAPPSKPTEEMVPVQDEKPLPTAAEQPPSAPAEPLPPPTGPVKPDLRNDRTGFVGLLRAQILMDRSWISPGEVDGRGGTNTTRGDVYGYVRDDRLNAANALSGSTLPMSQQQYGAASAGRCAATAPSSSPMSSGASTISPG